MFTSVAQANAAVIEQIRRARPHWLDVKPAPSLSSAQSGKTLLHAGPPMRWQEMTGPMKAPVSAHACLKDGPKDEMSALALLETRERSALFPAITLTPWGRWAVLPSASMPMLVWKISPTAIARTTNPLNEGIGKSDAFRRLWRGCSATFAGCVMC